MRTDRSKRCLWPCRYAGKVGVGSRMPGPGSVATLKTLTEDTPNGAGRPGLRQPYRTACRDIIVADPPRLPLPDHVHRLVSVNRSPGRLELAKALLGLHSSFDRSMILLQNVVQILDRSMSAAAAQGSFRFHCCDRRFVEVEPYRC